MYTRQAGMFQFDLFCTSAALLRPFVKSGLIIGREVQVEVKSVGRYENGRSTEKV